MCLKYFDGRLDGSDGRSMRREWRRGLDLAEPGRPTLRELDRLVRVQRRLAADLARRRRPGQPLHPGDRAVQARQDRPRTACRAVLVNLADWLRVAAILIKPFLPRTAETFYRAFNFEEIQAWDQVGYTDADQPITGHDLRVTAPTTGGKPTPLFPKIELREQPPR